MTFPLALEVFILNPVAKGRVVMRETRMQLCRYCDPEGGTAIGIVAEGRIHNATRAGLCDSVRSLLTDPDPWSLARTVIERTPPGPRLEELLTPQFSTQGRLLAPIDAQEVWASGVTYLRSRDARVHESATADIYTRVYDAARPELFLKSTPHRTVGPDDPITIRSDSSWNVPEAELAVALSPDLRIVGYTIGDDVSSRSIEGQNPLYLPQAKVWAGACALGPVITLAEPDTTEPAAMDIQLTIKRQGKPAVQESISTSQMKRSISELVSYLGRANSFPDGVFLLTGTGIVPNDDFSLEPGDEVEIEIPGIGMLRNRVELAPPTVMPADQLRAPC